MKGRCHNPRRMESRKNPTGQAEWAVLAPGGAGSPGKKADDVYSTFWVKGKSNSYGSLAGTSMAAPECPGLRLFENR